MARSAKITEQWKAAARFHSCASIMTFGSVTQTARNRFYTGTKLETAETAKSLPNER